MSGDDTMSDGPGTDAAAGLTTPVARRFVAALRSLEDAGEVDGLAGVGGADTRWWSTGPDEAVSGTDGARQFWSRYRRAFAEIRSEFGTVTETPGRVVLEWTSRGRHHSGAPVRYAGVTVLDLDGSSDDPALAAVRLYYDTAATAVRAPGDPDPEAPGTGGDGSMLDRETAASGRNSGLAPQD